MNKNLCALPIAFKELMRYNGSITEQHYPESAVRLRTKQKGCDFSMGIYTEKKESLVKKIKEYETRIARDTEQKKKAVEKLKEISRLAMAEEYNCKPRELDEIISAEHQLLQKLRSGGLSDEELLELVGSKNADGDNSTNGKSEETDFFADSILNESDFRSDQD